MKILYVTASPVPSLAANSVHVVKMAQALKNLGHDVTLLSPLHRNKGDINEKQALSEVYGVTGDFKHTIFLLPQIKGGVLLHALRTALYAKIMGVDIVFSRCLVCAWMATLLGIKTIFERHDVIKGQSPKVQKIFEKLLHSRNLLKIIVISQALKNHFIENYNVSSETFLVSADGADPINKSSDSIKLGEKPTAGYIGHLYKGRGIDIIIGMAGKMPHIDFHIVGGKEEDLEYWRLQVKNQNNIHLHGHIPHSQTANFLQSFDYLLAPYQNKVLTSGGENTVQWMSPLKIFEYMSVGKPILCSDLPVLHEVLEHQQNSILCIPDSVDDWVEKLNSILDNKEMAAAIGQAALSDFTLRYTWKKRAEYILENALKESE